MRGISGRGLFAMESQPDTWYRGMSASGPVYDAQSRNTASASQVPAPAPAQSFKTAMDIDAETLTNTTANANAGANPTERVDEDMADAGAEIIKPSEGTTSIANAENEMQM